MEKVYKERLIGLEKEYNELITRKNKKILPGNGVFERYKYPILTRNHTPLFWRYDLNPESNPYLMERFGINTVFNAGAIKFGGKYLIAARVEGTDRKSFFAIAESPNGIDNFKFWDYPIVLEDIDPEETNVYDMRLTKHEDGWIYGLFCSEKKDPNAAIGDICGAVASTGIIRSKDLKNWERLPNAKSRSHQRNVVLHPEYVNGKYALYTRPQDGFIDAGKGGGICWALVDRMENVIIEKEILIDERHYHTIKEGKNGQGPAPIKTEKGWLHLAHGVRACAAGLRYVLYMFLTDLRHPEKIIAQPAGYLMAPQGTERVGDVSNVLFSNGWIADDDGTVYIYYASSDTSMHVATSSVDRLLDHCLNTAPDGLRSAKTVERLNNIIENNKVYKGQL